MNFIHYFTKPKILCLDEANSEISIGDYVWVPPPDINDSYHFGHWEAKVIKISKDKKFIIISNRDGEFFTILARKTRLTYCKKDAKISRESL